VDGPEVIEGVGAAEVAALDQHDRQPALRCVRRDRQAVNTATDDEQIERAGAEPLRIPNHRTVINTSR